MEKLAKARFTFVAAPDSKSRTRFKEERAAKSAAARKG